jgi:cyclin-dependent kinase 10
MQQERGGLPQSTIREIAALRHFNHENIVRLICVATGQQLTSVFLVMEYCDFDLATLIDTMPTPFPENAVKSLILQLFNGLDAMHSRFFIHRDVKLSNLLLNSRGILKLADMGLARPAQEPPTAKTPNVVTLWYRAPELLFGLPNYSSAVDMWSAGCVLGELLDHKPILPGTTELQQLKLIVQLVGTPHDGIWPDFSKLPLAQHYHLPTQDYSNLKLHFGYISNEGIGLLQGLLVYDPHRRLSAAAAARHAYFRVHPPPCPPELLPVLPVQRKAASGFSS